MIQRFIILLMTCALLLSCQNEEEDMIDVPAGDEVAVQFSFGLPGAMETDTEYVPMNKSSKANTDIYPIVISNDYRALIVKKIGNRWVLDKMLKLQITPYTGWNSPKHEIRDGVKVAGFTTDLRPGEYRMTIITGGNSVTWNEDILKPGLVVEEGNNKIPMLCHYMTISSGYQCPGEFGLGEEIFALRHEFEVKKTEDLHTGSNIQPIHLKLERKVAKFRIMLYNETVNGISFNSTSYGSNAIGAILEAAADTPFPYGLNIWGEPYYRDTPVTQVAYGVFTTNNFIMSEESGNLGYFVPKRDLTQFNAFIFSDPAQNIPVALSYISHTFQSGQPTYKYRGNPINKIIKQNYIDGLIFQPDGTDWKEQTYPGQWDPFYGMELIYDGTEPKNPVGIFDNNIEYR